MHLTLRTRLLLVLIALAASSCEPVRPEDRMCQADKLLNHVQPDSAALERYFPAGFPKQLQPDSCGADRPRLSEVETEWFSKQWSAACEPPLQNADSSNNESKFSFRFSILPSFDSSLFMRLETHGQGQTLIVKKMTGSGGYNPGIIGLSKQIELTDNEVSAIRDSLAKIIVARDAQIAETRLEGPKDSCFFTFDGTTWIFETVQDGQYDLVQANSPREGPLFDLGIMLLTKAGLVDMLAD